MKLNGKHVAIVTMLSLGLFSNSAVAMELSQPVKLGTFNWSQVGHGFSFEGETFNRGDKYTKYRDNAKGYGKGMAAFGHGKDMVYVSYNGYTTPLQIRVGNQDMSSYVDTSQLHTVLYLITTDSGITLYPVSKGHSYEDFELIGKRVDGTFVTYVSWEDIMEAYFKNAPNYGGSNCHGDYLVGKMYTEGDTIVVPYKSRSPTGGDGEFRFQWNEDAQWFGIERIIY